MKRHYKNIIMAGLLATSMLSSCGKDFLDQSPASSIDADEALTGDYDVLTALRGAYAGLAETGLYGSGLPIVTELLSDNSYVSSDNSGYFTSIPKYTFTVSDADISAIWTQAYDVINRANAVINASPTVTDQVAVDQYKGEAYALRALMYFDLVRLFAKPYSEDPSALGVPIVTEFDLNAQPKRNTVAEVYAQIQSDLEQAYTLMTKEPDPTRFSKYAARALAAEVSLYAGDNAQALEYAEDVINNSGHELLQYDDVATYWEDPTAGSGYSETLFEVSATETENQGVDELGYYYNQEGYGQNVAAANLYDLYISRDEDETLDSTDVRKQLILVGERGVDDPAYIINKYPHISGDIDDKVVIRMSEVYLVAAEAAARLDQYDLALEYLNDLVSERDPLLVYTFTSKEQLIDDVILERRKELAFENDRFFTLNRLQRDITDRQVNPAIVEYGDYRRVLPIPRSEIDANKNIGQNEGWGS